MFLSYNNPQYHNDISLIRMNTTIKMNKNVQPIEYSENCVPNDAIIKLTGWGRLTVTNDQNKFICFTYY